MYVYSQLVECSSYGDATLAIPAQDPNDFIETFWPVGAALLLMNEGEAGAFGTMPLSPAVCGSS